MTSRSTIVVYGFIMASIAGNRLPKADAADPTRFEKAIRAFEQQDKKQPPPEAATLFLGSSSIRLWPLDTSFPTRPKIHRGFGGSTIADSVHYADRIVIPYRPKQIVFYAGDNDVAAGMSAKDVTADFGKLTAKVFAALPETTIVFISIKPSIQRWKLADVMKEINENVKQMAAKEPRIRFVDVWPAMLGPDGKPIADLFVADGLHLSPKGYELWTSLIEQTLNDLENSTSK
ncbi:MAG: GDSL-type esterase/lipase family protein [Planctomycetota bacterium]